MKESWKKVSSSLMKKSWFLVKKDSQSVFSEQSFSCVSDMMDVLKQIFW